MNTTLQTKVLASAVIAALLVIMTIFALSTRQEKVFGSVRVGDQYQSTTTPTVADRTNLCPAIAGNGRASSTTGLLGSVNVLSAGTGAMVIYDATTTNASLRSSDQATTTLILADYPTGFATTSNHFDIEFKRGLLVDYTTGVATSTISYRCEG